MPRLCHNCGREFKDGLKFCPYCGVKVPLEEAPIEEPALEPVEIEDEIDEDLDESEDASAEPDLSYFPIEEESVQEEPIQDYQDPIEEQPAPKAEAPKVNGKNKANTIINMIVAGLCLLVALLFFIGVFGPVFRVTNGTNVQNYGIKYLVKDAPESLRSIKNLGYARNTYYNFMLSTYVLEMVLYFGGMAGCLALTIVGLVKNIKALVKKEEPNINLLTGAGMLRLLSMFMFRAIYAESGSGMGYYLKSSFGWGGGLIIAGLAILLVCGVARNIIGAILTKHNLVANIVRSAVSIVMFILVFNVFGPLSLVIQYNSYYGTTVKMQMNGVIFAPSVLAAYSISDSATLNGSVFYPGIFSFAFTFAGALMLFNAYKKTFEEDSKAGPIVLSALSMLFLVVAAAFSVSAVVEYIGVNSDTVYTFAPGPIVGIILIIVLVIPGLVVSNIFNKKKAQ